MQKIILFMLALGITLYSFTGASAGEFKPEAEFVTQYVGGDAGSHFASPISGMGYDEHFQGLMRLRFGFNYIANENLSGYFQTQIGAPLIAGQSGVDGSSEFDSYIPILFVRRAYIDWTVPATPVKIRMGFQGVTLPGFAFWNAVFNTSASAASGVTVAAPINENIGLSAFWIRAVSDDAASVAPNALDRGGDDADIFAIIGDFDYDGFRIAPWAMYLMAGRNVTVADSRANALTPSFSYLPYGGDGVSTDIWYLGGSFEFSKFDPFRFALDAYYSSVSWNDDASTQYDDQNGYFVAASASYQTDWGIPALKSWYTSGDEFANGKLKYGRPATIVGMFNATSILFFDYAAGLNGGLANNRNGDPAGTWGILLEWSRLSFVEKLNHTLRIAYVVGTNDDGTAPNNAQRGGTSDLTFMTTEDSVIEFNINSSYQIYRNLSTELQLGYLTADFNQGFIGDEDDDIFRAALSFTYSF